MGDSKAFLTIHRQEAGYRPVHERITDYGEVEQTLIPTTGNYKHRAAWIVEYLSAIGLVH